MLARLRGKELAVRVAENAADGGRRMGGGNVSVDLGNFCAGGFSRVKSRICRSSELRSMTRQTFPHATQLPILP